MRKNKKLLLASVAAMGALALGVGATSTFAWYTATSTYKTKKLGDNTGAVAVESNAVADSDLKTTIHMVAVEDNVSKTKDLYLSAWKDTDANPDDEVHAWQLYTATKDTSTSIVTERSAGDAVLYRAFKISLWIENTSTSGTAEEWAAALAASNKTVSYTFSSGSLTNLVAANIKFYYETDADTVNAYDHDKEVTGNVATTAVAIKTLSQNENSPTQIGYLFVRIDGLTGDQTAGTTYSVVISADSDNDFAV